MQTELHGVQWPPNKQALTENFMGLGVPVYEQMFGSLSDDPSNPLSRVSVANVGFSVDATKGCPLRCGYCVRLSNEVDASFNPSIPLEKQRLFGTTPEVVFDGGQLVDALVTHPAFIPGKSVITISTGSSEAFASKSNEQTAKILHALRVSHDLPNPIWIVTKLGIPFKDIEEWREKMSTHSKKGPIVISITSSGLPEAIESLQRDRFGFVEKMAGCGVHFSHHLRPIIAGINDDYDTLRAQLERSLPLVESVCVGGLRVDPGIKIAWSDVSGLDLDLLPNRPGEKDLPAHVLPMVRVIMDDLGYKGTPLFVKSSHVLAHATKRLDHNLAEYDPIDKNNRGHFLTIPPWVYAEIVKYDREVEFEKMISRALVSCGLTNILFELSHSENGVDLIFAPNEGILDDYRTSRVLRHAIGHLNGDHQILPTNIYDYWRHV